ncbi:hypothetical protein [Rhizobium sp. TRM95796]|uniref:hypothetical protein n=1 Tax=Rhizobium sp. TRM95796 TaxID=2979862 RepID=UPI0021E850EB|nr:hypothetical protein [Rhizobium sp. TRM95796]MCV3768637.1 hypothetical protein [Rhizobium sp. TRM95796]
MHPISGFVEGRRHSLGAADDIQKTLGGVFVSAAKIYGFIPNEIGRFSRNLDPVPAISS